MSSPTSSQPFVYAVSEHKEFVSIVLVSSSILTSQLPIRLLSLLGSTLLLEGGVEVVAGNGTGHVVSVPISSQLGPF